jgi:carbon-monoxide dehydrogenase small subunit
MKIPVTLNEMPFTFDTTPSEKLVSALRREKILSVKNSCNTKTCGGCYILLDDKVIASCHIPVGLVKNSKIITLEHFSKTEFYSDIIKGFDKAGISLCGYCNAGKVFLAYEIIKNISQPTREIISNYINHLNDCCVEKDTLVNGILYAYTIHHEKDKTRRNDK